MGDVAPKNPQPPGPVGRRAAETTGPVDAYAVVTIAGQPIGTVAGVSDRTIVVEHGRWPFRSYRAIVAELAIVRDVDRTVIVLVSPQELAQSPKLRRDQPVDDAAVVRYYAEARERASNEDAAPPPAGHDGGNGSGSRDA